METTDSRKMIDSREETTETREETKEEAGRQTTKMTEGIPETNKNQTSVGKNQITRES